MSRHHPQAVGACMLLVEALVLGGCGGDRGPSKSDYIARADRVHDIGARHLSRLRELEQPSRDRDAIERFLAPSGRVVEVLGQAGQALARADVVRALAVRQRAQPISAEADAAARSHGFKRCGSVVSASA